MKKIIFLIFLCGFTSVNLAQSKVYLGFIDGEIDLGIAPYVKRVVDEAEKNFADIIVFKINTFGGRVDAATQIKDAIINSRIQTLAFIDKRAISAGALISLSCQKIVMVPGASIGATTVVDQTGKKQSEKYQSYMRSEMRATAERNGRRTDIAEGMVDETIVVEGLVDSTKLITLTSEEAVHYGIADTIAVDIEEALSYLGIEHPEFVKVSENWAEGVVRFINNPIITSLLMMIALVGLFTEIKTPGWGLPGTAAVIALVLFFGAGYLLDIASFLDIMIFIAGVILLIVEIFVLPGFGIFGVLGVVMIVAGLFMGLISDFPIIDFSIISTALIQLASSFVLSFIAIFFLTRFLPKTNIWNRLILRANINSRSGYAAASVYSDLLGAKGKALTDLRPAGTASINSKRIDVVTDGEYITAGAKIEVIKTEGSRVVVQAVKR